MHVLSPTGDFHGIKEAALYQLKYLKLTFADRKHNHGSQSTALPLLRETAKSVFLSAQILIPSLIAEEAFFGHTASDQDQHRDRED